MCIEWEIVIPWLSTRTMQDLACVNRDFRVRLQLINFERKQLWHQIRNLIDDFTGSWNSLNYSEPHVFHEDTPLCLSVGVRTWVSDPEWWSKHYVDLPEPGPGTPFLVSVHPRRVYSTPGGKRLCIMPPTPELKDVITFRTDKDPREALRDTLIQFLDSCHKGMSLALVLTMGPSVQRVRGSLPQNNDTTIPIKLKTWVHDRLVKQQNIWKRGIVLGGKNHTTYDHVFMFKPEFIHIFRFGSQPQVAP